MSRIYLSPPEIVGTELELLRDAFDSKWIAPLGPHVDAFEQEVAMLVRMPHALAVSSGTAALHLALASSGIGVGDEVWMSTLTFAATANAARYVGATPVFIDSDAKSWNMDPGLLEEALEQASKHGRLPKAVIVVDLYGQCAAYDPIAEACRRFGVMLIEDAAEALGATYRGAPAGSFGDLSVFSFNGNKIVTTSGGGMLLTKHLGPIERARYLATQARSPARHYEHETVGFNYRMSNLLAAVGRAQLADLSRRVERRREINKFYRRILGHRGWAFMPEATGCVSTFWLTCALLGSRDERDRICDRLEMANIEARPVWKPMHLQPAFRGARVVGGRVAEDLFERGVCLPSGSAMDNNHLARVVEAIGEE